MLPTHDVPCPHCGKPLFSALSLEDGVNAGAAESPQVRSDERGMYMTCPHCEERIAMLRRKSGAAEEIEVAPRQSRRQQ